MAHHGPQLPAAGIRRSRENPEDRETERANMSGEGANQEGEGARRGGKRHGQGMGALRPQLPPRLRAKSDYDKVTKKAVQKGKLSSLRLGWIKL